MVVTNPPYSDKDKVRTLDFVVECGKPGFVLIPRYVNRLFRGVNRLFTEIRSKDASERVEER